MNLANINWDLDHAGSWPALVKAAIILVLCLVLVGLWYFFDTEAQLAALEAGEMKEKDLRATFEVRYKKAVNLEEYRRQLEEMENSFGDLLRQLPDKTQIPDLLVEVSQTGLSAGLEFELFKPGSESNREFYAELPIEIRVIGDYLQIGTFVSGLAALPRIVTLHDFKITQNAARAGSSKKVTKFPLAMNATVKTYRYLETEPGNKPVARPSPVPVKP